MLNKIHLPSVLLGVVTGVALLATLAFAPQDMDADKAPQWDYRLVTDPSQDDVDSLAGDGWEYAGYLGRNARGQTNDDVLFKRRPE
jgi:hypothetical protein